MKNWFKTITEISINLFQIRLRPNLSLAIFALYTHHEKKNNNSTSIYWDSRALFHICFGDVMKKKHKHVNLSQKYCVRCGHPACPICGDWCDVVLYKPKEDPGYHSPGTKVEDYPVLCCDGECSYEDFNKKPGP